MNDMFIFVELMRARIEMSLGMELEGQIRAYEPFLLFEAYVGSIGGSTADLTIETALIGFFGFLDIEVRQSTEESRKTLSKLCELYAGYGLLSPAQINSVMDTDRLTANRLYQTFRPTIQDINDSGCWILNLADGKALVINLRVIVKVYSKNSAGYLATLMQSYVALMTKDEAETDAYLIIAIVQGLKLVASCDELENLQMTEKESKKMINILLNHSNASIANAGLSKREAELNWSYISKVINGFLIPSKILNLPISS